ncbi:TetR/AcrR family transcriptional regulator [Streptomyces oryzae]|uniref:TetR/AcrR family transcriptional regulator n=1 Tax=Streptomyces oryzae TaxID=1434886 RepID=A0ABS3X721_9ACTN|nr:TetR/AcrR family transcriptional regulator [Streptomyces oryzae]MBO8191172.1 TetR/AcrR family transcriptional regulator [Streptomyces oryzae]
MTAGNAGDGSADGARPGPGPGPDPGTGPNPGPGPANGPGPGNGNGNGPGSETAEPPPPGSRRPGGRTARVREQVLAAVGPLLVEQGFDGLTVDAVAARSGVHRATVYRRWRDVGGLLADVLDAAGDDTWRPADTGSLEEDLRALNEEVQEALTQEPSVALALIAASFRSEEAARALRRFWEERYARCEVVVERAVARGELSPPVDARQLVVSSTAPVYHQRVLLHAAPGPDLPAQAARAAALAARAGAFTSTSADA